MKKFLVLGAAMALMACEDGKIYVPETPAGVNNALKEATEKADQQNAAEEANGLVPGEEAIENTPSAEFDGGVINVIDNGAVVPGNMVPVPVPVPAPAPVEGSEYDAPLAPEVPAE